jgi:hypothetical protein
LESTIKTGEIFGAADAEKGLPEKEDLPSCKDWVFGGDSLDVGAEADFCEAVPSVFWLGIMASLATKPRAPPMTTPDTRRIEDFIQKD